MHAIHARSSSDGPDSDPEWNGRSCLLACMWSRARVGAGRAVVPQPPFLCMHALPCVPLAATRSAHFQATVQLACMMLAACVYLIAGTTPGPAAPSSSIGPERSGGRRPGLFTVGGWRGRPCMITTRWFRQGRASASAVGFRSIIHRSDHIRGGITHSHDACWVLRSG